MRRGPARSWTRRARVLGRHDGIIHFTVGQRKGLGLSGNEEPLFVLSWMRPRRGWWWGRAARCASAHILLRDVNWLAEPAARRSTARSRSAPCARRWRRTVTPAGGAARVELAAPKTPSRPARLASFTRDGRVLGGGWIARGRNRPKAARNSAVSGAILTGRAAPLLHPAPGPKARYGTVAQR